MPELGDGDAQRTGDVERQAEIEQALRRQDTSADSRKDRERHDHGGQPEQVRDTDVGRINPPGGGLQHEPGDGSRDVPDRVDQREPPETPHSLGDRVGWERHTEVTLRAIGCRSTRMTKLRAVAAAPAPAMRSRGDLPGA